MERRARGALSALVVGIGIWFPAGAGHVHASSQGAARRAPTCIFDHMTLRTPAGVCRPRARAYPAAITGKAERAIYDSSLTFGVPYSVLLAIGRCESGLNPRASDGAHFGLFQFDPSTFRSAAVLMQRDTGIVARSYWNPLDASYTAGYLFATGHSPSWGCERTAGS
jgi:hypothetical protein